MSAISTWYWRSAPLDLFCLAGPFSCLAKSSGGITGAELGGPYSPSNEQAKVIREG